MMNTDYKEIDEQFRAKYDTTFEALSKRLEENGSTIEEEDDWLEWGSALNMLNDADDMTEDTVLHIYNVPPDLVPAISKHNRLNPTNKINITQICADALKNALNNAR